MTKFKKILLKLILIILIILISIFSYIFFKGYTMYKSAIEEVSVTKMFTEIQEEENFTKLDEVPEIFINAVVAAEDKRFYSHNGIDLLSIGRAIKTDLITKDLTEGGSTITQQIAKNLYFTQSKQFSRKIAEMFVARNIEKNYSKNDILEIYININFYGSGYYGIYEASQGYFEKDPIDLTDYEATLLAGVPNAPSVYSPKVNLNLAERRQDVVLQKMIEAGYLTEDEKNTIQQEQITK
jgi:membrane peptidoglycan carboxypeptidase